MIYVLFMTIIMTFIAYVDYKKGIIHWQSLSLALITMMIHYMILRQSLWIPALNSFAIFFSLHGLRLVMNWVYRKDTFGMGDIHLLTVMTFGFNDIKLTLYVLVISSYVTLFIMVITNKKMLPFGPFLIVSWMGVNVYQIFLS